MDNLLHIDASNAPEDAKSDFEKAYLTLRQKEGRVYDDEIVRNLPKLPNSHSLIKEWRIRAHSANKLSQYLKTKKPESIVEVGCGNGWLTNLLASILATPCCGIDINTPEIQQAQRVFHDSTHASFILADPLQVFWGSRYDCVILASSIQYFKNLQEIIRHVLTWTRANGELHILDSPIYAPNELERARERSRKYFSEAGNPEMMSYYFHHSWKDLEPFDFRIVQGPPKWLRPMTHASPFPWVIIRKQE